MPFPQLPKTPTGIDGQPEETRKAQIIAAPTLIKELPFPAQRFVGDMSNAERILVGLNLKI